MKAFLLIGILALTSITVKAQTFTIPAGTYSADDYSDEGYTETILQGNRVRSGSVRFDHHTPIFITSDKSWVTQVYSDFPFGAPGTNSDYFLYQGRSEIQGIGGGTLVFDTLYLNNGSGNVFYLNNRNNATTEFFNPAGGAFIYSRLYFNNGVTATNRQYPVTGAIVFISNANYVGGLTDAQHVDGFVSESNLDFGTPLGHNGNFTYPVGNATSVYQLNRQGVFTDFDHTITVGWVDGDPEFTNDPTGSINHATAAYRGAGINAISRNGFWDWHAQRIDETTLIPRSLPNQQTITVSIPNFSYIPGLSASDLRLVGYNTATSKWENLSGSTGASGLTKGSTLQGIIPANTTIVALAVGSVNTIPLVASNAPGGVGFNTMQLWTKANAGVITSGANVSQWTNQAPISMTTQASKSANSNVALNSDAFNYNPTLIFTGADDEILSGAFATAPSSPAMLFAVTQRSTTPDVSLSNPYSLGADGGAGIAYSNHSYAVDRSGGVCAPTADVRSIPSLVRIDYNSATSTQGATSALNGLVTTTGACDNSGVTASDGTFQIGGRTFGSQPTRVFAGQIAEVIHYNVNNFPGTTADINKVESYLAVKYGITLDNSANGTLGGNYTSSSGNTIWDGSNAAYHHNIIGIGRDDNSGLLQKQSHITNDSTRIYVSSLQTGNNTNTGTIESNNSFVLAGSNEGQLLLSTDNTEYPGGLGIEERVDREWKVTNTNFNGTFSMDFKVQSANDIAEDVLNLRLLVDDDGDFSNASIYSPSIFYIGGAIQVTGINTAMIPANETRYVTVVLINEDIILPVELTSFTATPQNSTVQLNWTTATEQNNAYFGIERSADSRQWQQIGKVAGAGNSNQALNYEYTDAQPLGGTSYYRLKQTNTDGTYAYSETRMVRMQAQNPSLRVFPNPVTNQVNIQSGKAVTQINLLSTNGRSVLKYTPSRTTGGTFSINLQSIQSGIYLLQVINKDGTTDVIKVIKQ